MLACACALVPGQGERQVGLGLHGCILVVGHRQINRLGDARVGGGMEDEDAICALRDPRRGRLSPRNCARCHLEVATGGRSGGMGGGGGDRVSTLDSLLSPSACVCHQPTCARCRPSARAGQSATPHEKEFQLPEFNKGERRAHSTLPAGRCSWGWWRRAGRSWSYVDSQVEPVVVPRSDVVREQNVDEFQVEASCNIEWRPQLSVGIHMAWKCYASEPPRKVRRMARCGITGVRDEGTCELEAELAPWPERGRRSAGGGWRGRGRGG